MKLYLILTLLLAAIFPLSVYAQDGREDVVYMKNGSIYRGTIIEQVPNVSYKIEIAGGSVIVIAAGDIVRITKEEKISHTGGYGRYAYHDQKPEYTFHYRDRGYFIEVQAEALPLDIGLRIVNGYKAGQFEYLGLGLGFEEIPLDIHGGTDYDGVYIPIYIHYGGDILKAPVTPFYSLEGGYAFRINPASDPTGILNGSGNSGRGGLMGGAGFGARFYSRRKVHFDLSAHIDFQQASTNMIDNYGNEYTERTVLIMPGIRFGMGF